MKLLVLGHGRHGKDTACYILNNNYGLSFVSSSWFMAERVIFDRLRGVYNYNTIEECYKDRHNHRSEWFDIISQYNDYDASTLGREIFKKYDVYCGLRNKREMFALKNLAAYDYSIWVDRSEHLPKESSTSMNIEPWMCDFVIDNNRSIENLEFNIDQLMSTLFYKHNKLLAS